MFAKDTVTTGKLFGEAASEAAKKTKSGVTSAGKKVGSVISDAAKKTKSGATSAGKKVKDAAKKAADKIKSVFTRSGFYNYSSEPAWMQKISNSNISNWFYFFFVVNAIIFGLSLIFVLTGRGAKPLSISGPVLMAGAFSAVNTLFFYLLADRSLD